MGQVSPVRSRAHGLPSSPPTPPRLIHPTRPPTTLPSLHPRRATPTGKGFNNLKEEYEPGTLGFDPLNLLPSDPQELKELQTKELNNGEQVAGQDGVGIVEPKLGWAERCGHGLRPKS